MVSEGESQEGTQTPGVGFTRKRDRRARTGNSLVSWTDKGRPAKDLARSRSVRIGVSALKKKVCRQPVRSTAAFSRQTVR